jgi:Werner syndrome ATP-dependent helicase
MATEKLTSVKKIVKVKRFETYLLETYGYPNFRDKQRDIIEAVVKRKVDVCCVMATGYGKSICYQLPAIILKKPAIIISPLLSLMEDQRINLEKVGVTACCYNSSVKDKGSLTREILEGKYRVIYTTPETVVGLQDLLQKIYQTLGLAVIAIDEAHCISLWGNTFRSSYLQLSCLRDWLPKVPILALTGTATPKVEDDIITLLKLSNPLKVRTGSDRPNLSYYVHLKTNPMGDLLPHVINQESTIIYCQTRKDTEKITELLRHAGVRCDAYHAGLANELRNEIHHSFLTNQITCIAATISFGMGIDKRDIRKIIHYGCPKDIESYYQETGRGGRDGQPSQCHVYYSSSDFTINRSFLKDINDPVMYKYKEAMTVAIEKYLYTTECRRLVLLEYFGEQKKDAYQVCCDNCQSVSQLTTIEVGPETKVFLELVSAFSGRSGKVKMIHVIRGSKAKEVPVAFKGHPNFGCGQQHGLEWWKTCVQYMINDGLITEKMMSSGFGSVMALSPKGHQWLVQNQTNPSFKITVNGQTPLNETKQHVASASSASSSSSSVSSASASINQSQMTTYDLFQNQGQSIKDIAIARDLSPRTIEDHLAHCLEQGMVCDVARLGLTVEKYGEILKVIQSMTDSRLSPIKSKCSPETTYTQIKCVLAMQKSGLEYNGDS